MFVFALKLNSKKIDEISTILLKYKKRLIQDICLCLIQII